MIYQSNESKLIIDLIGRKNKKGNLIFKYSDGKIQKFITLKNKYDYNNNRFYTNKERRSFRNYKSTVSRNVGRDILD